MPRNSQITQSDSPCDSSQTVEFKPPKTVSGGTWPEAVDEILSLVTRPSDKPIF